MTREEVQDFLAMVQATYPNYNPPSRTAAVNAWTIALEEYSKNEIATAFKVYMQTNTSGFAPTPGQIIEKVHFLSSPQELNEMEAWALVSKAIRNSTYNFDYEFSKLPPLVQRAVGLPSQLQTWALDENYNEQIVSSHFIKCYREQATRQKEISKMPEKIRRLIQNVADKSYSAQISSLRDGAIKSLADSKRTENKALEIATDGIQMPDRARKRLEEIL